MDFPYGTIVGDDYSGWRYMVLGPIAAPNIYRHTAAAYKRWYSLLVLARPTYETADDPITIVSAEWIGNNVIEKTP